PAPHPPLPSPPTRRSSDLRTDSSTTARCPPRGATARRCARCGPRGPVPPGTARIPARCSCRRCRPDRAPCDLLPDGEVTHRLSFMENHSSDRQGAAPPTTEEARAALDTLGTDATRLAGRLVSPWWYHLTLGGLVAAAIGAQALPGVPAVTVETSRP